MPPASPAATTRKRPPPPGPLAPRHPVARARVSNGTEGCVLPGVDQRSAVARRFRDVIVAVVSDAGGVDRCSEAKLHLIRRFAALVVQAEAMEARLARGEEIDVGAHAHISSTLVRLATRIGVGRVPKSVVLDPLDYAREHASEDSAP